MKKLVMCVTILVCCIGHGYAQNQIKLVFNEYPPYTGKELPSYGVVSEVVREAFQKAGYKAEFKNVPFKRGIEETKKGKHDGFFMVWYREERKAWFLFSEPILSIQFGFYKMKERDIPYTSLEDLRPYTIGIVIGYAYPSKFYNAKLNTYKVTRDEQNIMKLHAGRIDVALITHMVAKRLIKQNFPNEIDRFEWMEPALQLENEYLVISRQAKDAQKKLDAFHRGLNQIKQEGIFNQILKKHKIQFTQRE